MLNKKSKHRGGSNTPIGGGFKKVLYTLQTVNRIGLKDSAKALTTNNTCKACGLGMGGQRGGMTNELDEFPSVCNKSIQAQSTDIQPPIPAEIFQHSIDELKELTSYEVEQLGRLGNPIYKAKGDSRYQILDWQQAIDLCVDRVKACHPERSFFYSSGRSSNEAGFLLQLFARLYGTNNVNNCSYYCHQATSVGLASTIGAGTATVELADLNKCDLIFVIGANPSSNHPRFIHKLKQCRERGGEVVVINPAKEPGLLRFAVPKSPKSMLLGGSDIASDYLQPRIGTDLSLLKGLAKAVIENGFHNLDFIENYTNGFEEFLTDIKNTNWQEICCNCGLSQAEIERVAKLYGNAKSVVFAWGMGMTHHLNGVENIEAIANLALLRAMVGKPSAGLLPLRGHSNVQGIGTIGVKPVLADEVIAAIEAMVGKKLPQKEGLDTLACLRAAEQGEMDVALVMGGNLIEASPDTQWAAETLQKIPFKLFLTTTLNRGHLYATLPGTSDEVLILPVRARDEESQPTTQESMFNYVRLSDGGIDRIEQARSEIDILVDLAKGVVGSDLDGKFDFSAFQHHDAIRETIAQTVPGMESLKNISVSKREFQVANRLMHSPIFNTPDKKANFKVLPTQGKIAYQQGFPLTLATVRSEGQFNSIIYEEQDSYRGTDSRWVVLMSREDIDSMNLRVGEKITLQSAHGSMKDVIVHPFDLPKGSLLAYYPEANVLTGKEFDPRSKTPAFKSVAVRVE